MIYLKLAVTTLLVTLLTGSAFSAEHTITTATGQVWFDDLIEARQHCPAAKKVQNDSEFNQLNTMLLYKLVGAQEDKAKNALLAMSEKANQVQVSGSAKFGEYLRCMADNLKSNSSNVFANSPFFGLELGMSKETFKTLGSKVFIEKPDDPTFGPYTMVDHIPGEPANTLERRLFFRDGYGLYRAVIVLGDSGGRYFKPDDAFLRWADMAKQLGFRKAKILRTQEFRSFDGYTVNDLRQCPKDPKLNELFHRANDEGMRKEVYGGTAKENQFLAIYCEIMAEPRFEFSFDGWSSEKIILAVIVRSPASGTINLVLVDTNIANLVAKERGSK